MNGADLPERDQPLVLSMLQEWTQAQTSCQVFSWNDPMKKQPSHGTHYGDAPNCSCMNQAACPYLPTRD